MLDVLRVLLQVIGALWLIGVGLVAVTVLVAIGIYRQSNPRLRDRREQLFSGGVADPPGHEVDVVPEGFDPRQPHVLYCMLCGRGAHAPSFATDVGPCPDCGGQRYSNRPDLPILGEPRERAR